MPPSPVAAVPDTPAWQALARHAATLRTRRISDLFDGDDGRAQRMSRRAIGILYDFSRQLVDDEAIALLLRLADETGIHEQVDAMFAGAPVNTTEQRPALHTALRVADPDRAVEGAREAAALAISERHRLYRQIADWHDQANAPHLVHLGVGGSDLGPRLLLHALEAHRQSPLRVDFASNLDPQDLARCLRNVDPSRALFVVASKSFTTQETLANAAAARDWLVAHGIDDPDSRFLAVTANPDAARHMGIAADHLFRTWEWVGGRYSLWSAVSLPVMAALGPEAFEELLAGAKAMDDHFRTRAAADNVPFLFALLDTWNAVLLNLPTRAVACYDERLRLLPEYLQQLVMESNGKRVTITGETLPVPSSPVIWGGVGSNAQHAFFQMLHQGTQPVSVEFLVGARATGDRARHARLVANCLAQAHALMAGNLDTGDPHRYLPGNRPSSTIMYGDLDPRTLGALLAFFEHRTVAAAMLLGINPFDQFGVELGKRLARDIADGMEQARDGGNDASTGLLLDFYREWNARG